MHHDSGMGTATRYARNVALSGYFGILLLIPAWIWWLAPPELLSKKTATIIWWLPALFPLVGLLKNKAFTFAWSAFLAVIYISQSITTLVASSHEQYLASIELIMASCWFAGATLFSRWRGQELGLELKKPEPQGSKD